MINIKLLINVFYHSIIKCHISYDLNLNLNIGFVVLISFFHNNTYIIETITSRDMIKVISSLQTPYFNVRE